jgi:site-specific DNA recombinase
MVDRHVALYARVSTEQQARDATIASQIAALREHIAADGRQLEPDHAYLDEGYSGSTLLRPALERLREPWLPATSSDSTSMPPTGWRAATPTRCF